MSFVEDMHQQAKKGAEVIAKTNAKKLVVLDSYDTSLVRHEYKNWGTHQCSWGTMDSMPEVPGIALRSDGHVGVYIGGGFAV